MGVWAFFLFVITFFETAKSSLLKNAHIKFVGNCAEEKTQVASSSFLINSAITIVFLGVIFLFSSILSKWLNAGHELEQMLKWFTPGLIALVFFSHLEAVAQSHLDFKSVFAGHFTRQLLFFLIIVWHWFYDVPFTLVQLVLYQSICTIVGTVVLYFYSRKHLLHIFNPNKRWLQKLLGFGGYIFGISITSNLFANIDQVMIARFTGSKSMVASYNSAMRLNNMIDVPSYSAAEILLPKVSQVNLDDGPQKVKYMYERMVGMLLCFTTPVALFVIAFPKFVMTLVAGEQYADAAFILQMYMIGGLIRPVQNQAANILLYIGKARLCFFMNILFLGLSVLFNYLCFLKFGPYGAAIGSVITISLGTVVWFNILKKAIGVKSTHVLAYSIETYKSLFAQGKKIFLRLRSAGAQG